MCTGYLEIILVLDLQVFHKHLNTPLFWQFQTAINVADLQICESIAH